MNKPIFKGLKVLDLSTVLAGPSVATFFAELGATVIKIENPRSNGDVTRSWKLSSEPADTNISSYFASVNFGKKHEWQDISSSSGKERVRQLIAENDILIVNFKQGDAEKFGLSASEVQKINPQIVYANIKGFDSNPERVAYDVVLQAETGFMFMNGNSESGPLKMPVAMMDIIAAHQLKEGILCALLQKNITGRGSIVECSLEKAGLSALVNQASNYLMAGVVANRQGSLHPNIAPYGETFTCKDEKEIVLAIGNDKQFQTLCHLLEEPSLSREEHFLFNQNRVLNRIELKRRLSNLFMAKTREEWLKLFIAENIPAGAIRSMDEVLQTVIAKSCILTEECEGITTKRMASVAFELH